MNEFVCGKCGWSAVAQHPLGVVAASEHHAKTGCVTDQSVREGEK